MRLGTMLETLEWKDTGSDTASSANITMLAQQSRDCTGCAVCFSAVSIYAEARIALHCGLCVLHKN